MSLAAALFLCTPVAVYDGDGPVHCREGQKLRIAGSLRVRSTVPVAQAIRVRRRAGSPPVMLS
jgi:hypothetical protein